MNIKTGYKQTEIGVIPEDWEVKKLGEILDKGRLGGNYPNQEISSSKPLIKMGNLSRGQITLSKIEYIPESTKTESEHRLKLNDVLFNTRNTLDLVGKVAIWRDELPEAYYNSNLMRLEFNSDFIFSNSYINYTLNTKSSIDSLRAIATGTTSVAAIYTRDLMQFLVPIPSLPEQTAIAAALSDVDALIGELDKLIAKKRDIKQATMQQLLTGKKRLAGFSGEWEVKRLGEICTPSSSRINPLTSVENYRCVELEHISQESGRLLGYVNSKELKSQKSVFDKNDVLFSKLRPYLKKYLFAEFGGVCTTEIWVLKTAKGIESKWLYYLIQSDKIIETANQSTGTKMPRAEWKIVGNTEILVPPTKEEQTAIATILSDMDAGINALQQKRDKTAQLKQGMMQELLTGRIRLPFQEI